MWKSSEMYNMNNDGSKTLPWGTPEITSTDTLALPYKTHGLPPVAKKLWHNRQELSSNAYEPQLIQLTAMIDPIQCSSEVLLNKPSLHAKKPASGETINVSKASLVSWPIRYENWERESRLLPSKKMAQLPRHDLFKYLWQDRRNRDRPVVFNIWGRRFLWQGQHRLISYIP